MNDVISAREGAPRIGDRYANFDGSLRVPGDFWRWRRERKAARLPRPPAEGYAEFARRWRVVPDFDFGLSMPAAATGRTDEGADDRRRGIYTPVAAPRPVVWWLGHATVLVRFGAMHLITDPHLGPRASPVSFFGPARRVAPPARAAELPPIDVVLVSHNHYDHLDADSIRARAARNANLRCYAPLGLGAWLRRRGIAHAIELDWWQSREEQELHIHCVPAQHWSARTPFDRNRTLWCGWVVRSPQGTFWFAGDTGYTPRLKEIADRLGPPDLAALPIGAYEPRWFMRPQHIDPAEAVRLHAELDIRHSLAIHWGTFELADESLDTPASALTAELDARGLGAENFWIVKHGEARFW